MKYTGSIPDGFQSTLPIREETGVDKPALVQLVISIHSSHTGRDHGHQRNRPDLRDFNPLFPYGKRPASSNVTPFPSNFNPLFPYGKRHASSIADVILGLFQSTLPIREETAACGFRVSAQKISIHSSHTGRDSLVPDFVHTITDFNPLFPYGKRRSPWAHAPPNSSFQSTLPIREETCRPNISRML